MECVVAVVVVVAAGVVEVGVAVVVAAGVVEVGVVVVEVGVVGADFECFQRGTRLGSRHSL